MTFTVPGGAGASSPLFTDSLRAGLLDIRDWLVGGGLSALLSSNRNGSGSDHVFPTGVGETKDGVAVYCGG